MGKSMCFLRQRPMIIDHDQSIIAKNTYLFFRDLFAQKYYNKQILLILYKYKSCLLFKPVRLLLLDSYFNCSYIASMECYGFLLDSPITLCIKYCAMSAICLHKFLNNISGPITFLNKSIIIACFFLVCINVSFSECNKLQCSHS